MNLRGLISRPATCLWSGDLDPRAHRRVALLAGSGFRVVAPERIADMGVLLYMPLHIDATAPNPR